MKKILIILPFVILAFMFSGCRSTETAENVTAPSSAYIGGDKGVELSFLANAPPADVYDTTGGGSNPFDISVKVENKGEYTIDGGKYKLTLSGVDPSAFGKSVSDFNVQSSESLVKTRRSGGETVPGTFSILGVPGLAYTNQVSGQLGPFNLRAALCYEYQTEVTSDVCVLNDLLGTTRQEGICKPSGNRNVQNSGGPVHVDTASFEQSVTGKDNIAFTFTVVHVGGDKDAVFKNEVQSCTLGDMTKQDKVGVQVLLGSTDITSSCSGVTGGVATLYGDTGAQIRCTQTLPSDRTDFVQPVKVTLKYDYYEYIDQPITVKQVGS